MIVSAIILHGSGDEHTPSGPSGQRIAVDTLGRFAEAGAERVCLQVLDLADLDHLDLIASEVMAQLA